MDTLEDVLRVLKRDGIEPKEIKITHEIFTYILLQCWKHVYKEQGDDEKAKLT